MNDDPDTPTPFATPEDQERADLGCALFLVFGAIAGLGTGWLLGKAFFCWLLGR